MYRNFIFFLDLISGIFMFNSGAPRSKYYKILEYPEYLKTSKEKIKKKIYKRKKQKEKQEI